MPMAESVIFAKVFALAQMIGRSTDTFASMAPHLFAPDGTLFVRSSAIKPPSIMSVTSGPTHTSLNGLPLRDSWTDFT
jgi:hypothetical protein